MRRSIAILFLSSLPLTALAEQTPPAAPEVQYRSVTEYTFTPEDVDGAVVDPDARPEVVRVQRPAVSLIRVRGSFNDRLLQSAEQI